MTIGNIKGQRFSKSIKDKEIYKYVIFVVALLGVYCLYTWKLTFSSIWYDEGVEYWYSKILVGPTPGGYDSANMYERIITTFQPPLYNILMHIWLSLFDYSVFTFRLAGVLTTILAAIGVFFTLKRISNYWVGLLAMLFFLLTGNISFYAMECAEYNLMLCCISWELYFFVRLLQERKNSLLVGFCVLSTLAVYSQYGASFVVIGLYATLLIFCLNENKLFFRKLIIAATVELIIAVVPLFAFFLYPQLELQGTTVVSHEGIFNENIIIGFFGGLYKQLTWCFSASASSFDGICSLLCIIVGLIMVVVSLFRHNPKIILIFTSFCITWILYFIAVNHSFYSYNDWSGNRGFGNKYGLFLIPVFVCMIFYGGYVFFFEFVKHRKGVSIAFICIVIVLITGFGYIDYNRIKTNWVKEDVCDGVNKYMNFECYKYPTYIHSRSDYTFRFYYYKSDAYESAYDDNLITLGPWIESYSSDKDAWNESIKMSGILNDNELYYVGCNNDTLQGFENFVSDSGYNYEVFYEGMGVGYILHCTKN